MFGSAGSRTRCNILQGVRASIPKNFLPQKCKTINSRYSLVVTHPTTNLPAHGLSTTERTGSPALHVLWSIAEDNVRKVIIFKQGQMTIKLPQLHRMPMMAADSI